MRQIITENYNRFIAVLAAMLEVQSIGKSGGAALPEAGKSDIDIFVICGKIPDIEERRAAAESLGDCVTDMHMGSAPASHWGTCDYIFFGQFCLKTGWLFLGAAKMDCDFIKNSSCPDAL